MELRYKLAILLILNAYSSSVTFANTTPNAPHSSQGEVKISHFATARAAALQGEMTREKRDELTQLFDDIAAGIEKLRGTTPWRKSARPDQSVVENLNVLVKEVTEKVGPEVAAAVLFDTEQDDYVRQISTRALFNYKGQPIGNGRSVPTHRGYTIEHLSLLCKTLTFLADAKSSMQLNRRDWTDPRIQRIRIAIWIGEVLDIDVGPKIDDDTGPLTTNVAATNPKLWLKNVLTHALTLERNKEHEAIIRGCLDSLK